MPVEIIDYGVCECDTPFESCYLDVRLSICDTIVVLSGVPQGVCPNCGCRVYKPGTLERLESLFVKMKRAETENNDSQESNNQKVKARSRYKG